MEILLPHDLMFCSVQHIMEVITDPQALANHFVVPFEHPVQGKVLILAYPTHFSACTAGTRNAAPKLGEHTNAVLHELRYCEEI